eukprot:TRINITY_DN20374_c0_g1_i5.p1 TRINITY_DN20374_c0_g1~~TRINITY_DN20374_c0_g1_i5.p1  ORF type:complete len:269 (+),score=40.19 TRINITY_DN20374_c0_g1_i5:146-952(+)
MLRSLVGSEMCIRDRMRMDPGRSGVPERSGRWHAVSTGLMVLVLSSVALSGDGDFISGTIDNPDLGPIISGLGMLALAPCMGWLVLTRGRAIAMAVSSSALKRKLHTERYHLGTRHMATVNRWATSHGIAAAIGFANVAVFPGSAWPVAHNLWSCFFFFNAMCYMHVSTRLDHDLAPSMPVLQSGSWCRLGAVWGNLVYLIMYGLYYARGGPALHAWAVRFEVGCCVSMGVFWISYKNLFDNLTISSVVVQRGVAQPRSVPSERLLNA